MEKVLNTINNLLREDYQAAIGTSFSFKILIKLGLLFSYFFGLVFFKVIATSLNLWRWRKRRCVCPCLIYGECPRTLLLPKSSMLLESQAVPISVSNFTLVGMAGMIAGILHAPLTAIFLDCRTYGRL